MGTLVKILVIALALVGLCVILTTYIPVAWHSGWTIPDTKIHVSWAVTAIFSFVVLGMAKLHFK